MSYNFRCLSDTIFRFGTMYFITAELIISLVGNQMIEEKQCFMYRIDKNNSILISKFENLLIT